MKKFLAMLMACVMILSLLPVTTFAAEESADHSHCPGKNATHTVANCAHAVTLETVKGDCVSYGYTVYQCPECDKVFADNFVKPTGAEAHSFKEIEAAVPATCTTDGKTAVVKCELCGTVDGGDPIPAAVGGHKWEKVNVVVGENGCTVNYKCSVCGETKAEDGAHDWNKIPEIVKEPGYYEEGEAKYTCQTCGKTKIVKILPEHTCSAAKTVAAVPVSCEKDGNIAYWICECGKYYDANGLEIEAEDVVIEKLGHDWDFWKDDSNAVEVEVIEAPTCTKVGSSKVQCGNCGEVKTHEVPMTVHEYDPTPTAEKAPTCEKYGYKLYACTLCGHTKEADILDPLGHVGYKCSKHSTTWDAKCEECTLAKEARKTLVYVAKTCTTDGSHTWNCSRCGEQQQTIQKASGKHTTVTVKVEARCAHYAYEFTYCTYKSCSITNLTTEVTVNGNGYTDTYDVTVNGKGVKLVDFKDFPEGGYNPENHTRDNSLSQIINKETCTEDGNEIYFCADCSYYDKEMVRPATGHDFDLTIDANVTYWDATCTDPGLFYVDCANGCGEWDVVIDEEAPALGHDLCDPVVVKPTCSTGGYTYVVCTKGLACYRSSYYEYDHTDALGYENYYDSIEEAEEIHNYTGTWTELRKGDCLTVGLYMSDGACADCGKKLLAIVDGTGEGHVEPTWTGVFQITDGKGNYTNAGFYPGESYNYNGVVWTRPLPATCLVDGLTGAYICSSCGTYVASEPVKAAGEHKKVVDVKAKDATCTENGATEGWHCGVEGCGHKVASQVIPAKLHMNSVCVDGAAQDCKQFGYTHTMCNWCGYEIIRGYAKETGHDLKTTTVSEPTCEVAGKTETVCLNGCAYDDYEKEGTIPATGHKNAKGETIVNACTDTVKDRICVNEWCDHKDPAGKNTDVPKSHTKLQVTYGEKTCISYAYTLTSCTACGLYDMVENTIDGYGDHTWAGRGPGGWNITVAPTYHEEGSKTRECIFCGKVETEVVPVMEGLGVIVEADNAAYAGATIVESSLVKVTVSIDANKVDVWGYNLAVSYNTKALKYVGADFSNATFGVNTASTAADKVNGVVKVAANYKNTVDGVTQNLNVNAKEVLVDLYFRVLGEAVPETYVYCTDIEVITKDGKDAVEYVDYMNSTAIVEIDMFLDGDNDGEVTIADCQMAYKILIGEPLEENAEAVIYDATLDVDKDGVITHTDVQMLYDYLVGNYEYKDMVAAGVK